MERRHILQPNLEIFPTDVQDKKSSHNICYKGIIRSHTTMSSKSWITDVVKAQQTKPVMPQKGKPQGSSCTSALLARLQGGVSEPLKKPQYAKNKFTNPLEVAARKRKEKEEMLEKERSALTNSVAPVLSDGERMSQLQI